MEERLLGYERVMHYVIAIQQHPVTKPRSDTLRTTSGTICILFREYITIMSKRQSKGLVSVRTWLLE